MASLDDLYAVSPPDRTVECHNILAEELWQHARIRLNQGKTCAFNVSGEAPTRIEALQAAAERVDPDARVQRGDPRVGQKKGNHHSGPTSGHKGVRFGAAEVPNWRARHILEHSGPAAHGSCCCTAALRELISS